MARQKMIDLKYIRGYDSSKKTPPSSSGVQSVTGAGVDNTDPRNPVITNSGGDVSSVNGQTGVVVIDKASVGLGNVDNTSDLNKPVSTAQAAALAQKGPDTSTRTNIEVNLSASQTITVGAFSAIVFNTKIRDALSEFNATTGVWTVANTGLYSVVLFLHFAGASDGATIASSVFVNGAESKRVGEQVVSNPSNLASVGGSCGSSCLLQLTAGDLVTGQAYISAAASTIHRVDLYASLTYFQAFRVL